MRGPFGDALGAAGGESAEEDGGRVVRVGDGDGQAPRDLPGSGAPTGRVRGPSGAAPAQWAGSGTVPRAEPNSAAVGANRVERSG